MFQNASRNPTVYVTNRNIVGKKLSGSIGLHWQLQNSISFVTPIAILSSAELSADCVVDKHKIARE